MRDAAPRRDVAITEPRDPSHVVSGVKTDPDKLVSGRLRPDEQARKDLAELPEDDLNRLIHSLELEMEEAAEDLRFEYAARLRDEIRELRRDLRDATS